jgi:hypothetical protein
VPKEAISHGDSSERIVERLSSTLEHRAASALSTNLHSMSGEMRRILAVVIMTALATQNATRIRLVIKTQEMTKQTYMQLIDTAKSVLRFPTVTCTLK